MPQENKQDSEKRMKFIGQLDAEKIDYQKVWKPGKGSAGFVRCASCLDAKENGIPDSENWDTPPSKPSSNI